MTFKLSISLQISLTHSHTSFAYCLWPFFNTAAESRINRPKYHPISTLEKAEFSSDQRCSPTHAPPSPQFSPEPTIWMRHLQSPFHVWGVAGPTLTQWVEYYIQLYPACFMQYVLEIISFHFHISFLISFYSCITFQPQDGLSFITESPVKFWGSFQSWVIQIAVGWLHWRT